MSRLLVATKDYEFMADAIHQIGGFDRLKMERKYFPDDERYNRFEDDVALRTAFVIGGTHNAAEMDEFGALMQGLGGCGVERAVAMIPYFGYSTMERAAKNGEIVTAKHRAVTISRFRRPPLGTRVMLVDLHVKGMQNYFEGDIQVQNVELDELIVDAMIELGGEDLVVVAPDLGRGKDVRKYAAMIAKRLAKKRQPFCVVDKDRLSGDETATLAVYGDTASVKDRVVVVNDDMIRTGSSIIGAALAMKELGASAVWVVASHGVLPGQSVEKLKASGCINGVIVTDTHPRAVKLADGDFLRIKSVAPLLSKLAKESVRRP